VSGLAIHNLRIESLMKTCYRSICSLLWVRIYLAPTDAATIAKGASSLGIA
jgi:hypothetical protein